MNNHDSFMNSNDFEIINNSCTEQDLLISHLENEIYKKELKQKDFADIHSKYEQMQIDIIALNESKNKLEYELNSLAIERDKQIKDLKNKNEVLKEELNKKNEINQTLYDKNNNIYIEIEEKEKDNKNLEKNINEQDLILNNLNVEKNEILKITRGISQKNELNVNHLN